VGENLAGTQQQGMSGNSLQVIGKCPKEKKKKSPSEIEWCPSKLTSLETASPHAIGNQAGNRDYSGNFIPRHSLPSCKTRAPNQEQ